MLLPVPQGTTVTVGSFDGVHLGHRAVLEEIGRRAAEAGRASVLVTFEPHPLQVVNPPAAPPLLTTWAERRELLAQLPLDYVALLRFDRRLASLAPEEFVREILVGQCGDFTQQKGPGRRSAPGPFRGNRPRRQRPAADSAGKSV